MSSSDNNSPPSDEGAPEESPTPSTATDSPDMTPTCPIHSSASPEQEIQENAPIVNVVHKAVPPVAKQNELKRALTPDPSEAHDIASKKAKDDSPLPCSSAAKMDKIDSMVGRWVQTSSKNFDEYLKAIGLNANDCAIASQGDSSMIIEKNGKLYKITVVTPQKTVTTEFELGKEFKETTGDGREYWSTIRMVDGKMVHEQKGVKNNPYEIWLEGDKLMMTGECDGIKYQIVFKRESSKE